MTEKVVDWGNKRSVQDDMNRKSTDKTGQKGATPRVCTQTSKCLHDSAVRGALTPLLENPQG